MDRARGENLRSIYVLLFLSVAFFFLEYQDPQKYARLFSFDAAAFTSGEVWRLLTFQFTQAGQGWFFFPKPLALFFTLLVLYIMGSAVEEEWGTRRFLTLFGLSTIASAAAAAWLGVPLLGSYFVNFTLLFVYASLFPQQTFYLFALLPVRVRWLAYIAAGLLIVGVVFGSAENGAAFAGAFAGYVYSWLLRVRITFRTVSELDVEEQAGDSQPDTSAIRNAARFVAMKRAVAARASGDIDRLTAQWEREIVRGVNICAPIDYKPEHSDGYCIRCEGFAECSARFLKMNRPVDSPSARPAAIPEPTA